MSVDTLHKGDTDDDDNDDDYDDDDDIRFEVLTTVMTVITISWSVPPSGLLHAVCKLWLYQTPVHNAVKNISYLRHNADVNKELVMHTKLLIYQNFVRVGLFTWWSVFKFISYQAHVL
jgi:hypothetical protein